MMQTAPLLEPREVLTGGHVKGAIVRAHLEWVGQYHGERAVDALMAMLGSTVRAEIESVTATSWCSFDALIALDRAIETRFGRGRDLMRELGRYSAHRNLSTAYRLFRRGNVLEFFRRSSLLHAQFQDFGRVQCHQLAASACEMRHVDSRCYSPVYCASALGYYEQVVVMHDGTAVTAEEVRCQCLGDEACVFRMWWV